MNKKLETAMEIAAKKNAHDRNKNESVDDRITSFDRYEFGFLDGFQKCYEIMKEREAPSVDDWREQAEALYQRLQELQSEGMDNHGDKMAVRKYEQFKKERDGE